MLINFNELINLLKHHIFLRTMSEAGKRVIFHELLTPEEALSKVFSTVRIEPLGTEVVSIEESYGRVLAKDVYSRIDVPPFDRATMDGFAVRAEDTFGADELNPIRLKVIGNVETGGAEELPQVNHGEAVEIATGAPPMPPLAPMQWLWLSIRNVVVMNW